jgi:cytochrome bd-type quinol oxidase subunit 2
MAFAHLDLNRKLLIVGAIAGVVMELAVAGGFFMPKGILPPIDGLDATAHRSLELLPFVLLGGVSLLVGVGAFIASMVLTATKGAKKKRRRRLTPRSR